MAQAVSRRPLTAEARVRAQVSARGIYSGQSGTGTGFSPSSSVFPCQYHSTVARHTHVSPGEWTIGQLVAAVQGMVSPHRHEQQQQQGWVTALRFSEGNTIFSSSSTWRVALRPTNSQAQWIPASLLEGTRRLCALDTRDRRNFTFVCDLSVRSLWWPVEWGSWEDCLL
jgi:hypothetical protein